MLTFFGGGSINFRPDSSRIPPFFRAFHAQAARHARELDKKTRALAILLQDDWANAVLKREKETRAVRLQLAQADADLAEQLDSIACLAVGSKRGARKASVRRSNHAGGGDVGEHEEEERETTGHEPEVFLGEGTGGIGMVALQVCSRTVHSR